MCFNHPSVNTAFDKVHQNFNTKSIGGDGSIPCSSIRKNTTHFCNESKGFRKTRAKNLFTRKLDR